VNSLETMRNYHYLLQTGSSKYAIVHSLDGYDEISLTGSFKLMKNDCEKIIHPAEFNMPAIEPSELFSGKTIKESAGIFMNVLNNSSTEAQKNAVIINSAFAIQLIDQKNIEDCICEAIEAIESNKALQQLKKLIKSTYEYAR
jgi:anthranilate phosphoribosyltransferase